MIIEGCQMQRGVSALIWDVHQGAGLQEALAQLCIPKLRCPMEHQLASLHPMTN